MLNNLLKYNLQFFAEDEEPEVEETDNEPTDDTVDVGALADLVSEKDKEIQQLQKDMSELKKTNAQLLVKVNSQSQPATQKKTFEENLLELVGAKPRKE